LGVKVFAEDSRRPPIQLFVRGRLKEAGMHRASSSEYRFYLALDAGAGDEEIAKSVGVGGSTVYRTKATLGGKAIWSGRRAKSRIPERRANSRAKPCL
jgi:hypothetical protein